MAFEPPTAAPRTDVTDITDFLITPFTRAHMRRMQKTGYIGYIGSGVRLGDTIGQELLQKNPAAALTVGLHAGAVMLWSDGAFLNSDGGSSGKAS